MNMKPMRPMPGQQQQVKVDLSQAETMKCEYCGNYLFIKSSIIKRMSPLVSPTGEEVIAPVQVFNCGSCGTLLPLSKELDELI